MAAAVKRWDRVGIADVERRCAEGINAECIERVYVHWIIILTDVECVYEVVCCAGCVCGDGGRVDFYRGLGRALVLHSQRYQRVGRLTVEVTVVASMYVAQLLVTVSSVVMVGCCVPVAEVEVGDTQTVLVKLVRLR
jgi:hypothetical protein